jgi:hypothetical protein
MHETASSVLVPWANFYVMAGSSAAALTGLMFVVITLVTRVERPGLGHDGINTFSTPTVLHFSTALFASAVLSAPWRSLSGATLLLGLTGLFGILYVLRAMARARRLESYRPDLEDWISYTVLPLLAYGSLLGGAIALLSAPVDAMFALAAGAVILLFMGIRNAWDIVTYIVIASIETPAKDQTD